MAKKQEQANGGGGDVVVLSRCVADGCAKKSERMNFCTEHYDWFKFGLLTTAGKKPSDFDKKMQAFMKHKKAA
jgi:hypothetical protein